MQRRQAPIIAMNAHPINTKRLRTTIVHTAKQFTDHLLSIYPTEGLDQNQLNKLLKNNTFFITIKFDHALLRGPRSDPSTYLNVFDSWFRTIMMESFGKHCGRQSKRVHQPLAFAFIDFPGSRYRRKLNIDVPARSGLYDRTRNRGSSELLKSGLLHIHAVVALRPGRGQLCRWPILNLTSLPRSKFGQIDIQQFDPLKGSLENLIEYSMKGVVQIGSSGPNDGWDQFPRFKPMKDKSSTVVYRQAEGSALIR